MPKAKNEFYFEQLVRVKEFQVLRDKLTWCIRREGVFPTVSFLNSHSGVNQHENCRFLKEQYGAKLVEYRNGYTTPFIHPVPTKAPSYR